MFKIFWRLISVAIVGLLINVEAQGANLFVKEIQSVRGRVQLIENEQAQSFLDFVDDHRPVNLNGAWQATNIEYTTQIGDQTAIVLGYSDATCSSRQALLIITAKQIWGPYQLGGCDDTLIYQRAEANNSFVAMNPRNSMAWVYTVSDERFRGPATIELPEQLRQFSRAPIPAKKLSAIMHAPRGKDAESNSEKVGPSTSALPRAVAAATRSSSRPNTIPSIVPTESPGHKSTHPPAMTAAQASDVANKVTKNTRSQKQVVIDLT